MERTRAVLLHNIRSAHNVGSIFRTADGAGVARIYLTGRTPGPLDRFGRAPPQAGRAQKDIAKTALGAERTVPWEYAKDPSAVIARLRGQGWAIVGAEQDARAVDYRTFTSTKPTLFVFGAEVRGLSKALRQKCDALIEIPMHGSKESLNVSVAAGIILFSFNS